MSGTEHQPIEYRWARGDLWQVARFAAELLSRPLARWSRRAIRRTGAKAEAPLVPMVFLVGGDPERLWF